MVMTDLWVDGDDLSAAAPHHEDPLQALCEHLQELQVWTIRKWILTYQCWGAGAGGAKIILESRSRNYQFRLWHQGYVFNSVFLILTILRYIYYCTNF